jgi:hypothetical protein
MKVTLLTLLLVLGLVGSGSVYWVTTAQAETPYEKDQREMQERYQHEHGTSAQVLQAQRWQQEWRQQHPNEPMPSFGALEKLDREEIISNTNQDFARMRQERQAKLKRDYLLSKQNQQRKLASQHITWTAEQWKNWDREYDRAMQQRAQEYLKAVEQAGEMARAEKAREEEEKLRRQDH